MARTPASGGLDVQIDLQILATLQDIASVLKSGRGASVLPGGGGGRGNIGDLLADLSHFTRVVDDVLRAMRTLGEAVTAVARHLTEFAGTQFGLASSASTTTMAGLLGQALGISNVAGLGASLHAASLSGLGAAIGGRYGIPYRPLEIGGATDRGEIIMKVIEGLRATSRGPGGMNAAIGEARTLGGGAESLLPLTLLSEADLKRLREFAQIQSGMYGQERLAQAVRFDLAMAELGASVDRAKGLLLYGLVPAINILNFAVKTFLATNPFLRAFGQFAARNVPLDANTQAVNQNTAALQYAAGLYGGGARTRSAIPGAFGPTAGAGEHLNNYLRGHAINWGAYSVGH